MKVRGWSPRKNSGRLVELSLVGRHPPFSTVRQQQLTIPNCQHSAKQGIGTIHKATRHNTNSIDPRVSHWPRQAMTQTVSPPTNHICWSSCVPATGTKDMGEMDTQAGHELTTWNTMEDQVPRTTKPENGRIRQGTQCKKKRTQDWTKVPQLLVLW